MKLTPLPSQTKNSGSEHFFFFPLHISAFFSAWPLLSSFHSVGDKAERNTNQPGLIYSRRLREEEEFNSFHVQQARIMFSQYVGVYRVKHGFFPVDWSRVHRMDFISERLIGSIPCQCQSSAARSEDRSIDQFSVRKIFHAWSDFFSPPHRMNPGRSKQIEK